MELRTITKALHCVANFMVGYQGDLFLDLPEILDRNETTLAMREMGSEIVGVGPLSLENLQRTLGVDYTITFRGEDIILENYRLKEKDFEYLLDDFKKFEIPFKVATPAK